MDRTDEGDEQVSSAYVGLMGPVIDVCQHPPRYMVRCSNCGIFAQMLTPGEAATLRDSHRCPT